MTNPFNITLDLEEYAGTSIFLGKTMREHAEVTLVNGFIKRNVGIDYEGGPERYAKVALQHKNEISQLKGYRSKYDPKKQVFLTSYYLPPHGLGRVNPVDHESLCIFHRPTRHSLCNEIYIDFDMDCAHQKFIAELAKMYHISCPALEYYVANKKAFRQDVANHFGISLGEAKTLLILLIFGGDYKTWLVNNGLASKGNFELIIRMSCELALLRKLVVKENPEIYDRIVQADPKYFDKPGRSRDRSVMAFWCQSVERRIQEFAIQYVVSRTPGAQLEDVVPCQDGFMLLASLFPNGLPPTLLHDIEEAVVAEIGLRVHWEDKPFDECLADPIVPLSREDDRDMTEYNLAQEIILEGLLDGQNFEAVGCGLKSAFGELGLRLWEVLGTRDQTRNITALKNVWPSLSGSTSLDTLHKWAKKKNNVLFKQLKTAAMKTARKNSECEDSFKAVAEEFEKTHCKIVRKSLFVEEHATGFTLYKESDLRTSYKDKIYTVVDKKTGARSQAQFIDRWLTCNPNQRKKKDMGVYPPGGEPCPDDYFNLWRPFVMEAVTEWNHKGEELSFILDHFFLLCGRDEAVYKFVMSWYAQLIQYPGIKPGRMPINVSEEGIGKLFPVLLAKCMCGANKVLSTANPAQDIFGVFNSLMIEAILVVCNEMENNIDEERLKDLITDDTIHINSKGIKQVTLTSHHRFWGNSNKPVPTATSSKDRRKVIFRGSDEMVGNKEYFTKLFNLLDDKDVVKTVYEYLKSPVHFPNMAKFKEIEVPETEYHSTLKLLQRTHLENWLIDYASMQDDDTISTSMTPAEICLAFSTWCCVNKVVLLKEKTPVSIGCNLALMKNNAVTKSRSAKTIYTFNLVKLRKYYDLEGIKEDPDQPAVVESRKRKRTENGETNEETSSLCYF